jgi:hypothetical protein
VGKDVQTGLRLCPELNDKVNVKAQEIGISKNALLVILIDLGWKTYESVNSQSQFG